MPDDSANAGASAATPPADDSGNDGRTDPATGLPYDRRATDRRLPEWAIPAIVLFWLGFLLTTAAHFVFGRLSGLLVLLLVSLFLALAVEPGVNRLSARGGGGPRDDHDPARRPVLVPHLRRRRRHARRHAGRRAAVRVGALHHRHGRPGSTTASAPRSTRRTSSTSSTTPTAASSSSSSRRATRRPPVARRVDRHLPGAVGAAVHVLPRRRRAPTAARHLLAVAPERQAQVLQAWELAITKTGGYLYSRALLALLSAFFHWIVFQALGTPAPVALALWVGLISQFLPVVGTYLAGHPPGAGDLPRVAAEGGDRRRVHRDLPADRELLLRAAHHRPHDGAPPRGRLRRSPRRRRAARSRRRRFSPCPRLR